MLHLLAKIYDIWSGRNLNDRDKTLKTSLPPCFRVGREIKKQHMEKKKEAFKHTNPWAKNNLQGF